MDFPLILKLLSVQHNENGNIWKAKSITTLKRILMRNVTSFHFFYTSPLIKFRGGGGSACYSAAASATAFPPQHLGNAHQAYHVSHMHAHRRTPLAKSPGPKPKQILVYFILSGEKYDIQMLSQKYHSYGHQI